MNGLNTPLPQGKSVPHGVCGRDSLYIIVPRNFLLMKIPCELVVWYLLPTIRKEVAKELVSAHGYSQADVARTFGVTDAAVSQYLKNKRGDNRVVTDSPDYPEILGAIRESSARIAKEGADFAEEVCRICMVMKKAGIINKIYEVELGCKPPACTCEPSILSE